MQVSVSLDPTIFSNIQAPKGTEANEGKNKMVTFSVMPDTEEELIISADVENLEMDPIKISAVPANIDRKSTRLNSSHVTTSYAVFWLKKKMRAHANEKS